MTSTADALRQLLPQAEQEQQQKVSLQAANADLERRLADSQSENADLRRLAERDREEITSLRNVRRREWAEKKELEASVRKAENGRNAAMQQAALAKQAAEEADRDRLYVEAACARLESTMDAIVKGIENDAEMRVRRAEEDARLYREEVQEMAGRLQKMARRLQKRMRWMRKAQMERDQLRLRAEADQIAFDDLRAELDQRPPRD